MKALVTFLLVLFVLPSAYSFGVDLIKTDPAPIVAGEYADITISYTNGGPSDAELKNFEISIEENEFILPVDSSFDTIAVVGSGEVLTGTFRVFFSEDLPQGFVDLNFDINAGSTSLSDEVTVFVEDTETKPQIFVGSVSTVPEELLPDTDNNKLIITLQNLGDKDAELVSAELVPTGNSIKPSYSYSFIDSVATIGGGSEADLEFTIDLEEEAKDAIDAVLRLRYRAEKAIGNTYDIYDEEISLPIEVSDAPLLEVEKVELLDSFQIASADNRMRVHIRNVGNDDAEEVRVRLVPDISYPFAFQATTKYVSSEIKVGETIAVEFLVEVLGSGEVRDYPMTVTLESLVSETRYSREDSVTISVTDGQETSNTSIGTYFLTFVVIVSVILGVLVWRKKRRVAKKKASRKN